MKTTKQKLTRAERAAILATLPETYQGRGISAAIAEITRAMAQHGLIATPRSVLAQHIAKAIPHVTLCLSYHSDGPDRKAYYTNDDLIVFEDEFAAAMVSAAELGITLWSGSCLMRKVSAAKRVSMSYDGVRWNVMQTYHRVKDADLGHIWRVWRPTAQCAGVRAYIARSNAGECLWLVTGKGWTCHARRDKCAVAEGRKAIQTALRAEKAKRKASIEAAKKQRGGHNSPKHQHNTTQL